jgi:hypothetical protein
VRAIVESSRGLVVREHTMPDKSPHRHHDKKPGRSIKEKRADKRAKGMTETTTDAVSHIKKR